MYEVYKRWPEPVTALVRDYGEDSRLRQGQRAFDCLSHGSLHLVRQSVTLEDIDLLNPGCIREFFRMVLGIRRLANGRPVILHCLRVFPEGIVAALYKKMFNRSSQTVIYVHGEELNVAATSRQLSWYARWVLARSDFIIANSRATREKTLGFKPGIADPAVIHPGVEWAAYQVPRHTISEQRKRWGCRDGQIVLTTVARLEARKNHKRVLAAMAALIRDGLDLKYIIVGDGKERTVLEDSVRKLGLADRVLFTGAVSNAEKILTFASADIHIMPSVEAGPMVEGYGIVFVEAAAAGVPSIAGNTGGQTEAVCRGKTGLIVDGYKEEQIAAAISRLVQTPYLAEDLSSAGRFWAQSQDWDRIAEKTWNLIREKSGAV